MWARGPGSGSRRRGLQAGCAPPSPAWSPPQAAWSGQLFIAAALIVLLALAARCWVAITTRSTAEDFFITLRYAERLAHGSGFTYNPGQRVLGTTTPLYTLFLAAAAWIGLPAQEVGKGANIVADSLTCALIVRLSASPGINRPRFGLLAALLYAVGTAPVSISIAGMETGLVTCAGMAAVVAYVEERWNALLALAAALFLLRIDTPALALILIASLAVRTRRLPWQSLALAAAIILPWLIFAQLYFGSFIPTSLVAKLTVYRGHAGAAHSVVLAAFVDQFAGGWPQRVTTLLFLVGAAAAARRPQWRLRAPLCWLAIYYGVMLVERVPPFAWYFLPPWPVYLLTAALGLAVLADRLIARRTRSALQQAWAAGMAILAAVAAMHLRSVRAEVAGAQVEVDTLLRPIGLYLRTAMAPADRVLLEPIGTIGYVSGRPVLDMIGLVSPEVLPCYSTPAPLACIVRTFRPEWMCLRPQEEAALMRQDPAALLSVYRAARTFTEGGRGEAFRIWRRGAAQDSRSPAAQ